MRLTATVAVKLKLLLDIFVLLMSVTGCKVGLGLFSDAANANVKLYINSASVYTDTSLK